MNETTQPEPSEQPEAPETEPDSQPAETEPETPQEPNGGDGEPETQQPVTPAEARSIGERVRESVEREAASAEQHEQESEQPETDENMLVYACPTCAGNGYLPLDIRPSPDTTTCDACNGLGKVLTGSLQEENAIGGCPRCSGAGYLPRVRDVAPQAPVQSQPLSADYESELRPVQVPQLPPYQPAVRAG